MPELKEDLLRARPLEILALLPVGILCGVLMGAVTNAINGVVSPAYFSLLFWDWKAQDDFELWRFTIEQGMLEGSVFGAVFSLILMFGIAFISKLRCPFRPGFIVLLKVMAFSLMFWIVGGFNGALLAQFLPQFSNLGLLFNPGEALRFAWVAGSIWGVYIGSLLSTIGAFVSFAAKWRRLEKEART